MAKSPRGQAAAADGQNDPSFFVPQTAQTSHYKKPPDAEVIATLYECYGNVTLTAKKLDVSRRVLYDWFEENPVLEEHRDKARRQTADHVESKLMELINGVQVQKMTPEGPDVYQLPPCKTSIIFYLKCQAGWSENPSTEKEDNARALVEGLSRLIVDASNKHDPTE